MGQKYWNEFANVCNSGLLNSAQGSQLYSALLNLFTLYSQVLFCIGISYLQSTGLQNSSKAIKDTEPPHGQN